MEFKLMNYYGHNSNLTYIHTPYIHQIINNEVYVCMNDKLADYIEHCL